MNNNKDHISVCICTFKRPALLANLLVSLQDQATDDLFTYSIVVVDNDCDQSAKATVLSFKEKTPLHIQYQVEPEQNIALARNKAVENAKGNFVALIDDDEFPVNNWLLKLFNACKEFHADGILGPVKPYFQTVPPKWIIKGKLWERETFKTGFILKDARYTRTGNVLLDISLFIESKPFDPRFGKTCGEDADFFDRMIKRGKLFIWCDEAPVFELVPQERNTRTYLLKRAMMRGYGSSIEGTLFSLDTLKSFIAVVLYTTSLPFFLIIGQHIFMKYLIKNCDHLGKLLGLFGIINVKSFF
jgi:succinoglycan biosynthesis protein ExoM